MTENNLFVAGDGNSHELKPLTMGELKQVFDNHIQIKWDESADLQFGYDPIPVFVHAFNDPLLTFSLVDCKKYNEAALEETFRIDINDYNLCHAEAPSTTRNELQLGGDDKTQRRIVFLMIHPSKMVNSNKNRKYEVVAAEMNTPLFPPGKWPQTAIAEALNARDAAIRDAIDARRERDRAVQDAETYASVIDQISGQSQHHALTWDAVKAILAGAHLPPVAPL